MEKITNQKIITTPFDYQLDANGKRIEPPKLNLKYDLDEWGKVTGYKSYKETLRLKCVDGCYQLLHRNIRRGFNPKWYIVSHFNDGGDNKRLQQRRLNPHDIDADLMQVKVKLMQLLYGRGWEKMRNRARCFFTIEYGNSQLKPHFNLLLEKPPKIYNTCENLSNLFNKVLPLKALCLWRNSSKVQPIKLFNGDIITLKQYISKENNFLNQSIPVKVNDYITRN